MLSAEQVKDVAKLARLEITEEEATRYAGDLSSILNYVDLLQEVDVEGVEMTYQVTGQVGHEREDVVLGCSPENVKKMVEQAPGGHMGTAVKVKKIL